MLFKKELKVLFPFLFSSGPYLAYGVEESPNKYPLDKVRYVTMAKYIHEEYLKRGRPIKILDIGCNEGMMILYCNKNNTKTEFYGIDILEEKKVLSLKRGYKFVALADLRQFNFQEFKETFDVVICSHLLEHLEHPGELLERLKPVISQGAVLIVGVPIGLLPGILWRQYISPLINPRHQKEALLKRFGHVSFFTLPRLKKLLSKSGFLTEDCRGDYLIRARGFFLENCKWWFDFNQWYGRLFPGLLGCVTLKARLRN